MKTPRTPEEILSYGTDVIQKHRHQLYDLKRGYILEVSDDSNNQKFNYNDYGIWKHEVKDYIAKHEKDKKSEIIRLFDLFERRDFFPEYLSEILGILTISIDHLESEENGESPDNSQAVQTTNETERHNQFENEPIEENPSIEQKKRINWKVLFGIITGIIIIIIAVIYFFGLDYNWKGVLSIVTFLAGLATILGFIKNSSISRR